MKLLLLLAALMTALSVSANVRTIPQTAFSDAGITWTVKAEGVQSEYRNAEDYPWRIASFEVVQPANTTNTFAITVTRFFDYEEVIVGEVTETNAFGVEETYIDTTVTDRIWRTMEVEVFRVQQNSESRVYSPAESHFFITEDGEIAVHKTIAFPANVYIEEDDIITVTHDSPNPVEIISLEGFDDDTDGIYAKAEDDVEGRPAYELDDFTVTWDGTNTWEIKDDGTAVYNATGDVATPDLVTQWKVVDGGADSDGDAIAHVGENVYFRINGLK